MDPRASLIKERLEAMERKGEVMASFVYGSQAIGQLDPRSDIDAVAIISDFPQGLRYRFSGLGDLGGGYLNALFVDRELFELDVSKGALGDFLADKLLMPYLPLSNPEYLRGEEIKAKERAILEILEGLILEYGRLAEGLLLDPRYFPLARSRRRAGLLPQPGSTFAGLKSAGEFLEGVMGGYETAIENLVRAGILGREGGLLSISGDFIDRILSKRPMARIVNLIEEGGKALKAYIARGRAGLTSPEFILREMASKLREERQFRFEGDIEDPRKYGFLKTSEGLMSLAMEADAAELIEELRPGRELTVRPLGGILNDVFLISAGQERFVIKRFTDWQSFKWFAINLVAFGTRQFALGWKDRLSNEYAMNRFLNERGIPVPDIIRLSLSKRILVEEYIEGETISDLVKRCSRSGSAGPEEEGVFESLGRWMARIHGAEACIGDSKPENMVSSGGRVYFLDLEQSSKGGDMAWDVAEFLYYTGHLVSFGDWFPRLVQAFLSGYREIGDERVLKRAGGLSYLKPFALWTPLPTLYSISRALRGF
jgi:tRNA A-37 threonylcarbamoyl transferase component Bud32/predicted nucleotidyltransferase